MFNALGLGFSFVLAAALLPQGGVQGGEGGEGGAEGLTTDCSNSSITVSDLQPVKLCAVGGKQKRFLQGPFMHSKPLFVKFNFSFFFLLSDPTSQAASLESLMNLQYLHAGFSSALLLLTLLYFPRYTISSPSHLSSSLTIPPTFIQFSLTPSSPVQQARPATQQLC